ncbi:MAG: immunity 26/phosphotriesterase HocA family protein [Chloroflexota bacterium]|nr:immunity 26/phosphotriesterase HocA family protein [Chloroflexota bacterium]
MSVAPTNLQILRRSRNKPEVGDIFAMLPPDGKYLFGRVIRTDALGPMKALLIYIYANRSESKKAPAELSPQSLLIAPTFTNALGWTHGRFETIENRPLGPGEVLERHCFYAAGRYYDEDAQPLSERTEPCGVGGVTSYRMLDDQISDALGIPRVPE